MQVSEILDVGLCLLGQIPQREKAGAESRDLDFQGKSEGLRSTRDSILWFCTAGILVSPGFWSFYHKHGLSVRHTRMFVGCPCNAGLCWITWLSTEMKCSHSQGSRRDLSRTIRAWERSWGRVELLGLKFDGCLSLLGDGPW